MNKKTVENMSVEEWADYILANPSPHDSPTTILKKSNDELLNIYQFFLSQNLKELENAHSTKQFSNAAVLAQLISQITVYFAGVSKINNQREDLIYLLRFIKLSEKIFNESMKKEMEVFKGSEKTGSIVIGLILFGSSINQAINSTAEWMRKSETLVENAYTNFYLKDLWTSKEKLDLFKSEEARRRTFLLSNHVALGEVIVALAGRQFPFDETKKSSPKTKEAFDNLKRAVVEYYQSHHSSSNQYDLFKLEPNNSDFSQIRQALLTQI